MLHKNLFKKQNQIQSKDRFIINTLTKEKRPIIINAGKPKNMVNITPSVLLNTNLWYVTEQHDLWIKMANGTQFSEYMSMKGGKGALTLTNSLYV